MESSMQQSHLITVLVTALISALIAVVIHYIPWRIFFGRELDRLWSYVLGTLSYAVPLSILFLVWSDMTALIALWVLIICAGGAVLAVNALDRLATVEIITRQAAEREKQLTSMVTHEPD
jgi:hypothetical protein